MSCCPLLLLGHKFDISQGYVATYFRCSWIFSDGTYYNFSPDSDSEIILKIG